VTLYSLSPSAYRGLIDLAKDPRWCPDYSRLLRYLDVAVSLKEAALLEDGTTDDSPEHISWTQIAFLDDQLAVPAKRLGPLEVIKKL
jgi:hypothetical protein